MPDQPATVKRWDILPPISPDIRTQLAAYHPVLAQVLYNRGQDTADKARAFLQGGGALHNPFSMHGMSDAVARLRRALAGKELIAVYGDFDADGVTSTALLTQALQALGGRVKPYIPNRVDEGYGLNAEALQLLKDQGVTLVVTVDCGIRSVEEVALGNELGMDVIVTDHHSVGNELPPALAVLDPKIDEQRRMMEGRADGYPEAMLAGVGVAYKLAEALFLAERQQSRHDVNDKVLEELLDLVALGTVADLAPLDRPENRELVRRGLEVLNRAGRPGIFELLQVVGVEPGKINATTIGFVLGPRINAAGRLDDAMIALNLLTAEMPHAGEYAQRLQTLNLDRQKLTMEAVELARSMVGVADAPLIFAASPDFRSGIVGLVAGRLCEAYYRPAVVVEQGESESRGSCRSIAEFDITQALDECAELLVRHGGHSQAAGFTVKNENLPALRSRLIELAAKALGDRDLHPTLVIDAEVPCEHLTMDLARALSQLEPTGARNEAPLFVTRHLFVVECRRVGQEGKHLRLRLSSGLNAIDAIAFKQGSWDDRISSGSYVDVAYHLEINEWNGNTKLQMNIQDLQLSGHLD